MNRFIRSLTLRPKTIFIVDGFGALVTAFLIFAILRTFNDYIGMPQATLTYLSLIAVIFCLYSTTCFFLLKDNWRPFLRVIIIANLLYCFLTVGLAISYHQSITAIGTTYFLTEIIVVSGLVFVELKTLNASGQKWNGAS
jgi:hypothetical protein